jgi:hypothetical protein
VWRAVIRLSLATTTLPRLVGDVVTRDFTAQTLGHKLHLRTTVHQAEMVVDEEIGQNRFRCSGRWP